MEDYKLRRDLEKGHGARLAQEYLGEKLEDIRQGLIGVFTDRTASDDAVIQARLYYEMVDRLESEILSDQASEKLAQVELERKDG